MIDPYLRPRQILDRFSRLYPDAWKQADEFRARRKELGDRADGCFLPLAGTYAIVSKGKTIQSPNLVQHVGVPGAKEYFYRERPGCRVFWDRERLRIEVDGTRGVAEARKYMGRWWARPGAF